MRRFLLTVAAAATALTGAACSDAIGLGSNIAGSYELRTINNQSLPVQLGSRIYEGGVLEIESNGTFVEVLQYRVSGNPLSTQDEYFGRWERDGDEIVFEYDDDNGTTYFGRRTSSSRILLEDNDGNDWSYQRF
jgi:hypothetical protein